MSDFFFSRIMSGEEDWKKVGNTLQKGDVVINCPHAPEKPVKTRATFLKASDVLKMQKKLEEGLDEAAKEAEKERSPQIKVEEVSDASEDSVLSEPKEKEKETESDGFKVFMRRMKLREGMFSFKDVDKEYNELELFDKFDTIPPEVFAGKKRSRLIADLVARSNSNLAFTMDSMSKMASSAVDNMTGIMEYLGLLISCMVRQMSVLDLDGSVENNEYMLLLSRRIKCMKLLIDKCKNIKTALVEFDAFLQEKIVQTCAYSAVEDYIEKLAL